MPDSIACEDFDLTPAIKDSVQESIDYIKDHSGMDCGVSVFIKSTASHQYKVIFRVRVKNKEIAGMGEGTDLYQVIGLARTHATRMLSEYKGRKLTRRKKQPDGFKTA
ncbi:MAG: HPF/RaiA family ribosome-associated protein [Bdellovibrionales bacterium]|nr:HPF/RaiA family ribosome-associated protein [Bdellovibrionales bacterium]